ncbi:MAG TPA: hypothetical protein DHV42_02030 [Lachnospiraceae bacterium]|nr:hypothetical protein [Lachnospiraceae bacterium]
MEKEYNPGCDRLAGARKGVGFQPWPEGRFSVSQAYVCHGSEREQIDLSESDLYGSMVTASQNKCAVWVESIKKDRMLALKLGACIETSDPTFGDQESMPLSDAAGLMIRPAGSFRFLSVYQHKEWWLRPAFGCALEEIPARSQCIIRKREADYEIFLAVSGRQCRADLKGTEDGLYLSLSSNETGLRSVEDIAMVYAAGADPYALLEEMVLFALEASGKKCVRRSDKPYPDVFRKWGWCTWDSLGQDVNEAAILEKMEDFKRLGLRVPWVLIDDGWSEADRDRKLLRSFSEDPERFPRGLAATVKTLKETYGVEHVGVWQAVKGYWNGVEPGSEAWMETAAFLRKYPNGETSPDANASSCFGFWDRWHESLAAKGISFVKVDSQSSFSLMTRGCGSYGETSMGMHKGLEASCQMHFNGNLINCMGMAPEDLWNRCNASLSRSSDDFTPTVPGTFREHAMQNSYNSILHGCFFWGDWDMAWSKHEESRPGLILRAISGGPFYVSDGCNATVPEEILPLIAEDGSVLKCDDVGRPTLDCLMDPDVMIKRPLKVYNRYRESIYIAAFLDREAGPCDGVLDLQQIPGTQGHQAWWIYDRQGRCIERYDREKGFSFRILPGEARLFQLIPSVEPVSVIGMTDKYISGAGIKCVHMFEDSCVLQTCCGGELSLVTQNRQIKNVLIRHQNAGTGEKADWTTEGAIIRIKGIQAHDQIRISWI